MFRDPLALRMLALGPALAIVFGLFGAAIGAVAITSLAPAPGATTAADPESSLSMAAYRALAAREDLLPATLLSLRVAALSTALATLLGFGLAVLLLRAGGGWRTAMHSGLPVPYLVAGLAMLWTLEPSGLVARLLAAAGIIDAAGDMPLLVQDPLGIGMVAAYTWKTAPFVALVALAALDELDPELDDAARSLGAGYGQRLGTILWPHARPALTAAAALVFAFTFGAFEIPLVLGATYPPALPLVAHRLYADPNIAHHPQAYALALAVTAIGLAAVAAAGGFARLARLARSAGRP